MILKYELIEKEGYPNYDPLVIAKWKFIDSISNANIFHRKTSTEEVYDVNLFCDYCDESGNRITIQIPGQAYLLANDGKTIERLN
jgi:hypothetical protein